MIILIHGENEVEKSAYITSLKNRHGQETVSLNVQNTDIGQLIQAVSTPPVFSPKRLVIFENFFTRKLPFNFSYVHPQIDLVILEKKRLSDSQLKKLPHELKAFLFKEEPLIFRFLDNIYPKNAKRAMSYFQKVKVKKESELLFWLITQHVRRLLLVKEGTKKTLSEQEKLYDWQIDKYYDIAQRFSTSHLKMIYKKIFSLEFAHKRGEMNLEDVLPLLIFELTGPSKPRYT